jgi:hypothetical protein
MDGMLGGQAWTLKRLPDSSLRPTTRRRGDTVHPFAASQGMLAIQRMLIDVGVFALAAGISLFVCPCGQRALPACDRNRELVVEGETGYICCTWKSSRRACGGRPGTACRAGRARIVPARRCRDRAAMGQHLRAR